VLEQGDTTTALAAMDAICTAAAQSRRLLKAAASGRKPRGTTSPAACPGQLRDLVQAHLAEHPDADFTPHAIGRVLSRSSGAVANALDRLIALGTPSSPGTSPAATATRPTRGAPRPPGYHLSATRAAPATLAPRLHTRACLRARHPARPADAAARPGGTCPGGLRRRGTPALTEIGFPVVLFTPGMSPISGESLDDRLSDCLLSSFRWAAQSAVADSQLAGGSGRAGCRAG
jgi:hypothetical protein